MVWVTLIPGLGRVGTVIHLKPGLIKPWRGVCPDPLAKRGKKWERTRENLDDQKVFVAN
jgi:hypothetical protein